MIPRDLAPRCSATILTLPILSAPWGDALQVSPRDLMPRDDLLMSLEVQLGSGVLEAQATTVEAASRIFKRGGDNMLYAALVAQVGC